MMITVIMKVKDIIWISWRVMNHNSFKFDNMYKDVTPRQLYADNVQEMVHKFVCDGRDGTISTHGFHVNDSSLHTMIHLSTKDLLLHIKNDQSEWTRKDATLLMTLVTTTYCLHHCL